MWNEATSQVVDTLVDIGTTKLHFRIVKGNKSVILFESGGALTLAQWDSIVTPVQTATGATIITYDRQGFGGSTIDTANYTILNEVKGFETGLKALGYENKRMIIVAHSLGASYARVYTSRHASSVKGIIMLDPRIPSLGDLAFARNFNKSLDHEALKKESVVGYYLLTNMERTIEFVRSTKFNLDLPILVIMAETGPSNSATNNERFQADQRNFVKESNKRSLLHAKGSSHNIPLDQPQLVINETIAFYKKYVH